MIIKPFVRDPYNYDRDQASRDTGVKCGDKTLTKQSFQKECDINYIAERFGLTGQWPANVRAPVYGDFTGIGSFHDAMNAVAMAHESFDAMPADVRARFFNDPAKFVDFCSNSANLPEMVRMGLAVVTPLPGTSQGTAPAPSSVGSVVPPTGS